MVLNETELDKSICEAANFYRILHMVKLLANGSSESSKMYPELINSIISSVKPFLGLSDIPNEEVLASIFRCAPVINYAFYDSFEVWTKLSKVGYFEVERMSEGRLKALSDTHKMPQEQLTNYKKSMGILAKVANIDFSRFSPYMHNKIVMDFGCGIGQYIQEILNFGLANTVFATDRTEILPYDLNTFTSDGRVHILPEPTMATFCHALSQSISGNRLLPTVFFLGQVIHSKAKPMEFLKEVKTTFAKRNEPTEFIMTFVNPDSWLQPFMQIQLGLHAGVDSNKILEELKAQEGFKEIPLENEDFQAYHLTLY